ncbi:MAG: hypothetical protein WA937_01565 [Flavobacteriales bacterium]
MKHLFVLFALAFTCLSLTMQAQIGHDITVFSEDGLPFTLILNGQTINAEPSTSVTAKDINFDFVKVEVNFVDAAIPRIERKNVQIATPGTAPSGPVAVVYAIKEKKGEQKLRFVSRSPKHIQNAPVIIINNN